MVCGSQHIISFLESKFSSWHSVDVRAFAISNSRLCFRLKLRGYTASIRGILYLQMLSLWKILVQRINSQLHSRWWTMAEASHSISENLNCLFIWTTVLSSSFVRNSAHKHNAELILYFSTDWFSFSNQSTNANKSTFAQTVTDTNRLLCVCIWNLSRSRFRMNLFCYSTTTSTPWYARFIYICE